jgi:methyltransferase-like protein/predicted O-methyltransferase YrrM
MTPDLDAARTSYDAVPYDSFPFPQTHPDRLATLGRLFGLSPAVLARCRVLELGCAAGGNLIPMALALPDAEFVGVDLSTVQVAQGEKQIADLGLTNIRLLAMSITNVGESFGEFDYILSHGVYSWVPNVVQEAMLAICAERLSENGIAYISYNTLPGWRMRGMIRDLMRYHAMQFADPAQRVAQARAILDFLAKWVPTENNAYGMLLKSELEGLRRSPDYYILHEHLEDINEPLYFHEFMERAVRHGLQYLAEADFSTMLAANFPPEVNDTVVRIAPDVIRQEQFMDFLRNRTFRQTLLVRQGLVVNRTLTPERVMPLWVSALLLPVNPMPELATQREEAFRASNGGMLKTPNPVTKAAMVVLARHWPEALGFVDLLREALALVGLPESQAAQPGLSAEQTLASDLLQCYGAGLVELHSCASGFVLQPGARPKASPLARWQAARGLPQVTTLRHELATIDANLGRLLGLLDGTREREAIYRTVMEWTGASPTAKGMSGKELAVRERVDQALTQIGRSALLLS